MIRSVIAVAVLALAPALAVGGQRPEMILQGVGSMRLLAISPDGRYLASTTNGVDPDGSEVDVWDITTGHKVAALPHGSGHRSAAGFSPDSRLFAYSAEDARLALVNVGSGNRTDVAGAKPLGPIVFSPDGRLVAFATLENTVELWDVAARARVGEPLTRGMRCGALALSSDGVTLTAAGEPVGPDGKATGDSLVRRWNIETRSELTPLVGHTSRIAAVAIDRSGARLATSGRDGTIRLWSAATGRELRSLDTAQLAVVGLAFSRDGRKLESLALGFVWENGTRRPTGELVIWDADTGAVLSRRSSDDLASAMLAPDGSRLVRVTRTSKVTVEEPVSGRAEREWTVRRLTHPYCLAFSPTGRRLVVGGIIGGGAAIWNLADGGTAHMLDCTDTAAIAMGADERSVLVSCNVECRLLDADSGREVTPGRCPAAPLEITGAPGRGMKLAGLGALATSSDGRSAALVDIRGGVVTLVDVATLSERLRIPIGDGDPEAVALSPDGGSICIAVGPTKREHYFDEVTAVDDVPVEKRSWVRLYRASDGRELRVFGSHNDRIAALAFSPDGNLLASASWDHGLKVWEVASGRQVLSLAVDAVGFNSVVFSPDGQTVVASSGKAVYVWEIGTGRLRRTLGGNPSTVSGIAFSPDGLYLATAGFEGGTRVWDAASGELLATLYTFGRSADWLVVTPDGLFDGSPGGWSQILWRFSNRLDDVAPVEAFFDEYYEPGLLTEILSGRRPRAARDIATRDRRLPATRVEVHGARDGEPVATRRVTVRVTVSEAPPDETHGASGGVRDVRLFRNGSLVRVWRGNVLGRRRHDAVLEAEVAIAAGENRFVAYAFNHDNVKSEDASVVVLGAASLARAGTAYVLAIGVDRYEAPDFDLKFAGADMTDFAESIRRGLASVGTYRNVEITELRDEQATKVNVLAAIAGLRPGPEDAVLIYFAGHGFARADRFYLVPHDLGYRGSLEGLDAKHFETIARHSISDAELEAALERLDAGEMLLVIDACDSGQLLAAADARRGPMNSRGIAQMAYDKGMYVLAGSQPYQAALESPALGHGYLTYALVEEGLKSDAADVQPRDGAIDVREWFDFTERRVPELRRRDAEAARTIGLREDSSPGTQRPRVFYRRDSRIESFVVKRMDGDDPLTPSADSPRSVRHRPRP